MIGFCILGYIAGVVTLCASIKISCGEVTVGGLIICLFISAISFIPVTSDHDFCAMAVTLAPAISGAVAILIDLLVEKANKKLF